MKVPRTEISQKLLSHELRSVSTIIELGAGLGIISKLIELSFYESKHIAIDLFTYKKGQQYPLGKSVINLYEDQITIFRQNVSNWVIPIKASAISLASGFPDKYADLIIIDLGDEISNQAAYNLWKNKATHIIEIID